MSMFIDFGAGKCPVCGDFSQEVQKSIFHCGKCKVSFNKFYVATHKELAEYENKYWN